MFRASTIRIEASRKQRGRIVIDRGDGISFAIDRIAIR